MVNKKSGLNRIFLDNSCFLEGVERAILLDSAECTSGDSQNDSFLEFRDVDALLLEIRVTANLAAGIKLRCTGAVRISSSDD